MKAHALALFTILVWSTTFVAALVWSVYSALVDRIVRSLGLDETACGRHQLRMTFA